MSEISLGANYLGDGHCRFIVWAPKINKVNLHITAPQDRLIPLARNNRGYHHGIIEGVEPGSRYFYVLDGDIERPDPASRYQPEGVHGPSEVVNNLNFTWSDDCWFGLPRRDLIIYELHVGTFSPEGTLDSIIPYLDNFVELGINAIEIMPIAQFPGSRNWGYDGVYPFAVQNSYGGPKAFQRLVNACHKRGLAVILDVVYNHLGPEGNYLSEYGPYFTDSYTCPWGNAINFDGTYSDEVRRYFLENALYWLKDFHVDAFRLDAVHAIKDFSAFPFLEELNTVLHKEADKLGRRVHIIAESDLNDARIIKPVILGGYGMDVQWTDDFHHSLHTLLTGEHQGYYKDFGKTEHLARALKEGYTYTGQYSNFRLRRHGNSAQLCSADQFVVFSQNHDQVGNRAIGDRLTALTSFSGLKLAACAVIFSPFIPMLFMGEEYGETAPFQYFTSHTDLKLAEAVHEGRRREFADFDWGDKVPDPQKEETFLRSCLNYELHKQGKHQILYQFYRQLIKLRRELPALANLKKDNLEIITRSQDQVIFLHRWYYENKVCIVLSFSEHETNVTLPVPEGHWYKRIDSSDEQWLGGGSKVPAAFNSTGEYQFLLNPKTCILFQQIKED